MSTFRNTVQGCILLTAILVGCGSDDGGSSNSSGGTSSSSGSTSSSSGSTAGRTGVTECGAQSCQAGQYCLNLMCTPGCSSEANCTGNQTCVKDSGKDIGSCQATSTPSTKDCPAYVKKCTACGLSADQCTRSCEVITADCASCVLNTSGCSGSACDSICEAE